VSPRDDALFAPIEGATPLDPDECAGLRPSWIASRADLDSAETANIAVAMRWTRRARSFDVLDPTQLIALHRRMFGDVWTWAGATRTSERNIGIAPHQIRAALKVLCDDVRVWIELRSYEPCECLARFHHRLVAIHPFPNGNGRHARLATDVLARRIGEPMPTWGMQFGKEARAAYLAALRSADTRNYAPLCEFIAAR
jgi:Fic-DOC domain mobile mystery protein B